MNFSNFVTKNPKKAPAPSAGSLSQISRAIFLGSSTSAQIHNYYLSRLLYLSSFRAKLPSQRIEPLGDCYSTALYFAWVIWVRFIFYWIFFWPLSQFNSERIRLRALGGSVWESKCLVDPTTDLANWFTSWPKVGRVRPKGPVEPSRGSTIGWPNPQGGWAMDEPPWPNLLGFS